MAFFTNLKKNQGKTEKTVFIHIGAMKTGTTAIQSVLYHSTRELNNLGFQVPEVAKRAKNYLGFSLLSPVPELIHHKLEISVERLYSELTDSIKTSDFTNFIISTESFYQISITNFAGEKAPGLLYKLLNPEENKFNIKIVFFVRRQDRLIESIYNQIIKTHHLYSLYSLPFHSFINDYSSYCDLLGMIKRWESVFGKENMIIVPYTEKETNSVTEFFGKTGCDLQISSERKISNESLNNWECEFMRSLNEIGIQKPDSKSNKQLVTLIKSVSPDKTTHFSYFHPEERTAFLSQFSEHNRILSETYLKGETSWYTGGSSPDGPVSVTLQQTDLTNFLLSMWNHLITKTT